MFYWAVGYCWIGEQGRSWIFLSEVGGDTLGHKTDIKLLDARDLAGSARLST
jgi:hypothetical protein